MVKPVDQDGNYIIDSNDRIILGNKNPNGYWDGAIHSTIKVLN